MKYRAILFDADGVIFVPKRFSEQLENDFGISREKTKPFFDGPYQECKLGKADVKEQLSKIIVDWGWQGSVEDLMEYWFKVGSDLNKAMIQLVGALQTRGVKCYLATNNEKYRIDYLWKKVGLEKIFDGLFVSSTMGHTKDEPAFFEQVFRTLRSDMPEVKREEILFVDHDQKNLMAAHRVEIEIHHYQGIEDLKLLLREMM